MKNLGIKGLKLFSESAMVLCVMYYSLKGSLEVAVTVISVLIALNIVEKLTDYRNELDNWYEGKYGDKYGG